MRYTRALLALFWTGLTVALCPSPAQAAFIGRNGWLMFSALSRTGSTQVWRQGPRALVDVTGTFHTREIMHHDNYAPTWSADRGAHVVFVSAPRTGAGEGVGDIWMMSPWPGLKPTNLLTNLTHSPQADDESPAWDFTGGHVVYSSAPVVNGRDRAADIWKTSWTGRGTRNLTRATASDDVQPAWSPRKRVIAFVSNRSDRAGHRPGKTYGIWLMDATDGKVLRKLTADGSHPNWKSDGSEIAFVRGGDVWVMNADGTAQKQLTHDPAVETNPAWSPDGHKIAFQVGDGPAPEPGTRMAVMNADGSGRHGMLGLPRFRGQSEPDWRPECSVRPHREAGGWVIRGTPGNDLICFEKFPTTIDAGAGDDSIYGGSGDNVIDAGPGNDIVLGGAGNDILKGGPGRDYLEGDDGSDKLYGGSGDDILTGGGGGDYLFDRGHGSGDDGLFAGPATDVCVGDPRPVDAYAQCETMRTR